MLRSARLLLRSVGLDYSCFRIYAVSLTDGVTRSAMRAPTGYRIAEVGRQDLERSPHRELRDCCDYLGDEASVFGVYNPLGAIVCAQCIWYGERYRRATFWPLDRKDAASMHLICAVSERSKGLATWLKQESAEQMRQRGFSRMYSRIWWTNRPSLRVSEKAGWEHVGTIIELKLWGHAKSIRTVRKVSRFPESVDTFAAPVSTRRVDLQ